MCLSRAINPDEGYGYQVKNKFFNKNDNPYYTSLYFNTSLRQYPNRTVKAVAKSPGFHVFMHLEDAQKYCKTLSDNYYIVYLKYKKVKTFGEHNLADGELGLAITCESIKIMYEV